MHILNSDSRLTLKEADDRYGGDDAVYVFDFDGVIIEHSEDVLYRIPDSGVERPKLEQLAKSLRIDASLYDTCYLRHLVLQGVLLRRKVSSPDGPLMNVAKALGRRPFFVLTARTGAGAVMRVSKTLRNNSLFPQEIFHVGQVSKTYQLQLLHERIQRRRIVFIDDNLGHCESADAAGLERLVTVRVVWPDDKTGARAIQQEYL